MNEAVKLHKDAWLLVHC